MLIGITGYAQVGKSTAADYLDKTYGFDEVNFADALRELTRLVNPVVSFDDYRYEDALDYGGYEAAKQDYPGVREFLKALGNGAREILGPNVWVDAAMRRCTLKRDYVFADCRFLNEVAAIRNFDPQRTGFIIRIHRPGVGPESDFEREVDHIKPDFIVVNDGAVTDLYNRLAVVMESLRLPPVPALAQAG